MKLAYIAGPFRAANAWQRAQNIREAEQVGMAVTWLGVMPIIPHANTGNFDGTLEDAFWLDGTLEIMRRCDLVICTDRWTQSKGAQAEVAEALRLNMPVYIYADGEYRTHLPDQPWKVLQPWELRAIINADWKREITIDPSTNSISATLAACSAPVPDIIRVYPTGAGDHGNIDVTTGDGLFRYAVQQVLGDHGSDYYAVQQMLGRSLRDVTAGELAKLGLKPSQPDPRGTPATPEEYAQSLKRNPSQPEPPPISNGASALYPRPFFWDSNDLFCFVNCQMTPSVSMDFLLQCVPNALDGRESHHPLDTGDHPRFGFRLEHTGPRTLREYLEAP